MCSETRGPQDQPMTVLKSKLYIEPFQNLSNADTFSLSVFSFVVIPELAS